MKDTICPICQKKLPTDKNQRTEFLPFCSRRCQMIDLGHWLKGDYHIPGELVGRDEPEEDRQKT